MGALEKVVVLLLIYLVNDELVVSANCVPVVLFCCGKVLPAKIALVLHHGLKLWMVCGSVLFQQQHCDEDLVAVTAHVSDIVALSLHNVGRKADGQWFGGLLGCHRLHSNPVISSHCDYCLLNLLNPDIFPIILLPGYISCLTQTIKTNFQGQDRTKSAENLHCNCNLEL